MRLRSAPMLGMVAALLALVTVAPPESPVADAAMRGDVQAVEALLAEGADVNAAQGDGMTALHWAAEHGDAELARMLLRAGANLSAVTRIGAYTPLHVAARAGSAPVLELLVEAGADVSARAAASGATALHLAAAAGDTESIRFLVDHGADPDVREHQWGQTPLIFAAGWNRADAIRTLIAAGADPEATTDVVDLEKQEDLQQAADARRDELLQAFLGDSEREPTPSELKAAIEAAREILESGELPEEPEEDPRDRFRGPPTILKKGGLTPLLHAVRQGHTESIVALLDGGADVNTVSESDGTSPLLMATINGQFDDAMLLLERGADPNLAASLNDVAPLWAAINSQWQPRTRYPQPQERGLQETGYLELMEALLEAGADPDARISLHPWYLVYTGCGNGNCGLVDMQGSTAFWRAAYATDVAAMELLAEHGADPHIPTTAGNMMDFGDYRRLQVLEELKESAFAKKDAEGKAQALRTARGDLPGADAVPRRPGERGSGRVPRRDPGRVGARRLGGAGQARPLGPPARGGGGSGRLPDPRRLRRGVRRGLRRKRPPPRARRVDGRHPLPGGGDGRRREHARRQRLHGAPPRRLPGRQRDGALPGGAGRRRHGGEPGRADHGRHGQRAGAARLALPGDGGAPGAARVQEQPQLPELLTARRPG